MKAFLLLFCLFASLHGAPDAQGSGPEIHTHTHTHFDGVEHTHEHAHAESPSPLHHTPHPIPHGAPLADAPRPHALHTPRTLQNQRLFRPPIA